MPRERQTDGLQRDPAQCTDARLAGPHAGELVDPSGAVTPLETQLSYDPADPFAVSATFSTVAGRVRWTFGRDQLTRDSWSPSATVTCTWPCVDNDGNSVVIIELSPPDSEALVQGRTAQITAFVERMTRSVAPGAEGALLDVDAAITTAILADAA